MKMNRKNVFALLALMLICAWVLPMLTACGGGGLELPTEEEETLTQEAVLPTMEIPVPGQTQTEDAAQKELEEAKKDPMWDYIPPENYMDYSNLPSLNSTANIGTKGSMVVRGGNSMVSYYVYQQQMAATDKDRNSASVKRTFAEKEMRGMLSVLWTPEEDVTYSYHEKAYAPNSSNVMERNNTNFALNQITLEKGKIYQGLPYTNGSNNAAAFVLGATQSGDVYTVPLNSEILSGSSSGANYANSGYINYTARLGINDSDALLWAWSPVAPSLRFIDTATMTVKNGVLPVGSYKQSADGKALSSLADATDGIVSLNGDETMLESYAKLQKADGLVTDTASFDHAMMVVSVTVEKDKDGKIDPAKSYVTVLEQTDANLVQYQNLSSDKKEEEKDKTLVVGNLDKTYTFKELLDGSYLPVTCKELNEDGSADNPVYHDYYRVSSSYSKSTLFSSYVYTDRRVVYLTQTVTDKDGKVVMDTTLFPTELGILNGKAGIASGINEIETALARWDDTTEKNLRLGDTATSVFTSGKTYHTELKALLVSGEYVTLRDYEFQF